MRKVPNNAKIETTEDGEHCIRVKLTAENGNVDHCGVRGEPHVSYNELRHELNRAIYHTSKRL